MNDKKFSFVVIGTVVAAAFFSVTALYGYRWLLHRPPESVDVSPDSASFIGHPAAANPDPIATSVLPREIAVDDALRPDLQEGVVLGAYASTTTASEGEENCTE